MMDAFAILATEAASIISCKYNDSNTDSTSNEKELTPIKDEINSSTSFLPINNDNNNTVESINNENKPSTLEIIIPDNIRNNHVALSPLDSVSSNVNR
jgi:hypothetical protein